MRTRLIFFICKYLQLVIRGLDRGGTALPGLLMEKLNPNFLRDQLSQLPEGYVLITGTNGKTTTTKMVTTMLELGGKRVLSNRSGSNFTRGIASAIISEHGWFARRIGHDIAVLEVDEAYAGKLIEQLPPRIVVALNVSRDQLDRFGEVDMTTGLIANALAAATQGCVVNASDPHLAALANDLKTNVSYFDADPSLQAEFSSAEGVVQDSTAAPALIPDVVLQSFTDHQVTYLCGGKELRTHLQFRGGYNYLNGAAAIATTRLLQPEVSDQQLIKRVAKVRPAFGRGEILHVKDQDLELVLVKNPASFRQNLAQYRDVIPTIIALNDYYADGRDISWIWDVDFSPLRNIGSVLVSGTRARDMAIRLAYDDVAPNSINPRLPDTLSTLLDMPGSHKRIFCTYTAMLALRRRLGRYTSVEKVI